MSLSQDVEHLTALIYSKLPHTAGETSADSEATLVGLEGTSEIPVVAVKLHRLGRDTSGLTSVRDRAPQGAGEGEDDPEVVAGGALDGGRGRRLHQVLPDGVDGELPGSLAAGDALVPGGHPDGHRLAVGVAGVGGPTVL